MNLTEQQIWLDNIEINYIDSGEGQAMLFLHNGGGFWQTWEKQIGYFSKNYRVLALDWPGFGESSEPDGLISLELLTKILIDFISKLRIENVILVGNCIGGSAAYVFSQRHPEKVKKLIVLNICPGALIFPNQIFRSLFPALNKWPLLKKAVSTALSLIYIKSPLSKKFPSILFADNFNQKDPIFLKYLEKIKEEKQTRNRIKLLFSVHTYTLSLFINDMEYSDLSLIWGEQNKVTSFKNHGIYHKELLKPKKFYMIPNAGHLCMYEQPEIVNEIIDKYICSK